MSVLLSQFTPPASPAVSASQIYIPALQIGSSVPFFFLDYMHMH